ncbi:hypothetical protein [Streptomyces sp. SAI-041]|nr:hypothetical protein [Streptomyces sp. SAI-041]MDH6554780.1 hypothetical protein [Streptomyces sp. SAI-041]
MTEITDPLSDPRKNEAAWRALDLARAYAAATVPRASNTSPTLTMTS